MKSSCTSVTLGLVILTACQPVTKADVSEGTLAAAVFGALAAGGAFVGGLVHWHHTSDAKKAQEAEKEKKIVSSAMALFEKMKKHQLLQNPQVSPSYQNIAQIHQGRELADLKDEITSFLVTIKEQKEQLRLVTGKYAEPSDTYYSTAQTLHDDLAKLERAFVQYQELFNKLDAHRDQPLVAVKNMEPFVQKVQSQVHSADQFVNFVTSAYGAAVTKDEIKGLPLICATEDISKKLIEVEQYKRKLEAHQRLIQNADPILDATIKQLDGWEHILKKATYLITSSKRYHEQVTANQTSKIARLNAQAEYEQKNRERAIAERELVNARKALVDAENRSNEIALANKQATTNMINSAANTVNAVNDLSNAREQVAQERQKREAAEEKLQNLRGRVRELEVKIRDLTQQLEMGREGYCRVHGCPSNRCPDLTCRY